MFCRFCGAHVPEDSLFCSKCGKNLGRIRHPRLERIIGTLHLRTPYPYSGLIVLFVVIWAFSPHSVAVDYSALKWTVELDRKLDIPEENLFQQGFSLILENVGSQAVAEIPVRLVARIEPPQPVDITVTFLGNHLPLIEGEKEYPLTVILSDQVKPGNKRSYLLESSIQAPPPFKVTYEIREEESQELLTNFVVER